MYTYLLLCHKGTFGLRCTLTTASIIQTLLIPPVFFNGLILNTNILHYDSQISASPYCIYVIDTNNIALKSIHKLYMHRC